MAGVRVVRFHADPVQGKFRFHILEGIVENFLLLSAHGHLLHELIRPLLGLLGVILDDPLESTFPCLTRHPLAIAKL